MDCPLVLLQLVGVAGGKVALVAYVVLDLEVLGPNVLGQVEDVGGGVGAILAQLVLDPFALSRAIHQSSSQLNHCLT
jgi:hypothetical protein